MDSESATYVASYDAWIVTDCFLFIMTFIETTNAIHPVTGINVSDKLMKQKNKITYINNRFSKNSGVIFNVSSPHTVSYALAMLSQDQSAWYPLFQSKAKPNVILYSHRPHHGVWMSIYWLHELHSPSEQSKKTRQTTKTDTQPP